MEQLEKWTEEATDALCTCGDQQKFLRRKTTEAESFLRRNNIQNFSIAEGEEYSTLMPEFIDKFPKSKLSLPDNLDLKIQRAHRSLTQKPPPDAPPRSIIVNFLEFVTKEVVLKAAWEESRKEKIQLNDRVIYFYHDYPVQIKKHKEYKVIKKALKAKGIRFQMPYTNMQIHWDTGSTALRRHDRSCGDAA